MNNAWGLPEPLVKALTPQRRRPVPGRIGVTTLIDSPLRRILTMQHFDEIEEDASENLWSLLGSAVHYIIERGDTDTEIKLEQPVFGATLVGVVDYYKDAEIIDWKITSKWSAVFADNKDWERQLQTYRYLVQLSGKPVDKLSVYMILRDWNKREAQKNPDQPQIPFVKISYEPWSKSAVEAFISERVSLHLEAEKIALASNLGHLPANLWCTTDERWMKPDKWAVKKKTQERAIKVYDSEGAAKKHFGDVWPDVGGYFIEHRPGEQTKCLSYCAVSNWCPFWNEVKGVSSEP